jgi:hypothetical protein
MESFSIFDLTMCCIDKILLSYLLTCIELRIVPLSKIIFTDKWRGNYNDKFNELLICNKPSGRHNGTVDS